MSEQVTEEACQRCHRVISPMEMLFLLEDRTKTVCRECHDDLRPLCPHCGASLKKRAKAKTKCRTCGEFFYVEDRQTLFPSTMITGAQRDELHEIWQHGITSLPEDPYGRYARRKAELHDSLGHEPTVSEVVETLASEITNGQEMRDVLVHLEPYGLGVDDYEDARKRLRQQLGRQASSLEVGDALWGQVARTLENPQDRGESGNVFTAEFRRAEWLRRSGRDPAPALQGAEIARLWQMESVNPKGVRILCDAGTCRTCRENRQRVLNGRRGLTIAEALSSVQSLIGICGNEECPGVEFEIVLPEEPW